MPPVPEAVPGETDIRWLRSQVPRFRDGAEHHRRRAAVQRELDRLDPEILRASARARAGQPLAHVRTLLAALDLPESAADSVALVAAAYQPHQPITPAADAAVTDLVTLCRTAIRRGIDNSARRERQEDSTSHRIVALICVLIQACGATGELLAATRAIEDVPVAERAARIMADAPPLQSTRRMVGGVATELDLRHPGLGFGAGPHRCPGAEHALAIATGLVEGETEGPTETRSAE